MAKLRMYYYVLLCFIRGAVITHSRGLAVLAQLLLQPADIMQFSVVFQLLQAPELIEMDRMCQSILINKQV